MSEKIAFTQARIRDLPLPEHGRVEYRDLEINALACRISASGNKSFILIKRLGESVKRVTLGKFPALSVTAARKKARAVLAELDRGVDPIQTKRKQKIERTTLINVLDQYLANRDLKAYTKKDYRYKLKLGFSDWLEKPAAAITEKMIIDRQKEISENKGHTTANNTMRVLRLTLNYADAVHIISGNPASILSKARLWHKNKRKSRVIPSDQLRSWREAVDALANDKARVFLFTLLYMGSRATETITMRWQNVDLKSQTIKLENTKNGTDHIMPMPDFLISEYKKLKKITGSSLYVFASDNNIDMPMTAPNKPIKSIIAATGIEFSSHDCRRTFATIAEAVGLPLSMIKRLLNHVTSNDVTGGYIVTEDETLRLAINSIADYINNA